ncbi:MAG TPA: hypothetical protein VGN16_01295 [Acidobacteriaceae bacterium]|jgi:hypothetical protein
MKRTKGGDGISRNQLKRERMTVMPSEESPIKHVLAGGLFALFVALIVAAVTVFGVISMVLGHIFIAIAGLVGTVIVWAEIFPQRRFWVKAALTLILWVAVVLGDWKIIQFKHAEEQAAHAVVPSAVQPNTQPPPKDATPNAIPPSGPSTPKRSNRPLPANPFRVLEYSTVVGGQFANIADHPLYLISVQVSAWDSSTSMSPGEEVVPGKPYHLVIKTAGNLSSLIPNSDDWDQAFLEGSRRFGRNCLVIAALLPDGAEWTQMVEHYQELKMPLVSRDAEMVIKYSDGPTVKTEKVPLKATIFHMQPCDAGQR